PCKVTLLFTGPRLASWSASSGRAEDREAYCPKTSRGTMFLPNTSRHQPALERSLQGEVAVYWTVSCFWVSVLGPRGGPRGLLARALARANRDRWCSRSALRLPHGFQYRGARLAAGGANRE